MVKIQPKIAPPPQRLQSAPLEAANLAFDQTAYLKAYQDFISNSDPKQAEPLWRIFLDRFRAVPVSLLNTTLPGSDSSPASTYAKANDLHEALKAGSPYTVDRTLTEPETIAFYEYIKASNLLLIDAKQFLNDGHPDKTLAKIVELKGLMDTNKDTLCANVYALLNAEILLLETRIAFGKNPRNGNEDLRKKITALQSAISRAGKDTLTNPVLNNAQRSYILDQTAFLYFEMRLNGRDARDLEPLIPQMIQGNPQINILMQHLINYNETPKQKERVIDALFEDLDRSTLRQDFLPSLQLSLVSFLLREMNKATKLDPRVNLKRCQILARAFNKTLPDASAPDTASTQQAFTLTPTSEGKASLGQALSNFFLKMKGFFSLGNAASPSAELSSDAMISIISATQTLLSYFSGLQAKGGESNHLFKILRDNLLGNKPFSTHDLKLLSQLSGQTETVIKDLLEKVQVTFEKIDKYKEKEPNFTPITHLNQLRSLFSTTILTEKELKNNNDPKALMDQYYLAKKKESLKFPWSNYDKLKLKYLAKILRLTEGNPRQDKVDGDTWNNARIELFTLFGERNDPQLFSEVLRPMARESNADAIALLTGILIGNEGERVIASSNNGHLPKVIAKTNIKPVAEKYIPSSLKNIFLSYKFGELEQLSHYVSNKTPAFGPHTGDMVGRIQQMVAILESLGMLSTEAKNEQSNHQEISKNDDAPNKTWDEHSAVFTPTLLKDWARLVAVMKVEGSNALGTEEGKIAKTIFSQEGTKIKSEYFNTSPDQSLIGTYRDIMDANNPKMILSSQKMSTKACYTSKDNKVPIPDILAQVVDPAQTNIDDFLGPIKTELGQNPSSEKIRKTVQKHILNKLRYATSTVPFWKSPKTTLVDGVGSCHDLVLLQYAATVQLLQSYKKSEEINDLKIILSLENKDTESLFHVQLVNIPNKNPSQTTTYEVIYNEKDKGDTDRFISRTSGLVNRSTWLAAIDSQGVHPTNHKLSSGLDQTVMELNFVTQGVSPVVFRDINFDTSSTTTTPTGTWPPEDPALGVPYTLKSTEMINKTPTGPFNTLGTGSTSIDSTGTIASLVINPDNGGGTVLGAGDTIYITTANTTQNYSSANGDVTISRSENQDLAGSHTPFYTIDFLTLSKTIGNGMDLTGTGRSVQNTLTSSNPLTGQTNAVTQTEAFSNIHMVIGNNTNLDLDGVLTGNNSPTDIVKVGIQTTDTNTTIHLISANGVVDSRTISNELLNKTDTIHITRTVTPSGDVHYLSSLTSNADNGRRTQSFSQTISSAFKTGLIRTTLDSVEQLGHYSLAIDTETSLGAANQETGTINERSSASWRGTLNGTNTVDLSYGTAAGHVTDTSGTLTSGTSTLGTDTARTTTNNGTDLSIRAITKSIKTEMGTSIGSGTQIINNGLQGSRLVTNSDSTKTYTTTINGIEVSARVNADETITTNNHSVTLYNLTSHKTTTMNLNQLTATGRTAGTITINSTSNINNGRVDVTYSSVAGVTNDVQSLDENTTTITASFETGSNNKIQAITTTNHGPNNNSQTITGLDNDNFTTTLTETGVLITNNGDARETKTGQSLTLSVGTSHKTVTLNFNEIQSDGGTKTGVQLDLTDLATSSRIAATYTIHNNLIGGVQTEDSNTATVTETLDVGTLNSSINYAINNPLQASFSSVFGGGEYVLNANSINTHTELSINGIHSNSGTTITTNLQQLASGKKAFNISQTSYGQTIASNVDGPILRLGTSTEETILNKDTTRTNVTLNYAARNDGTTPSYQSNSFSTVNVEQRGVVNSTNSQTEIKPNKTTINTETQSANLDSRFTIQTTDTSEGSANTQETTSEEVTHRQVLTATNVVVVSGAGSTPTRSIETLVAPKDIVITETGRVLATINPNGQWTYLSDSTTTTNQGASVYRANDGKGGSSEKSYGPSTATVQTHSNFSGTAGGPPQQLIDYSSITNYLTKVFNTGVSITPEGLITVSNFSGIYKTISENHNGDIKETTTGGGSSKPLVTARVTQSNKEANFVQAFTVDGKPLIFTFNLKETQQVGQASLLNGQFVVTKDTITMTLPDGTKAVIPNRFGHYSVAEGKLQVDISNAIDAKTSIIITKTLSDLGSSSGVSLSRNQSWNHLSNVSYIGVQHTNQIYWSSIDQGTSTMSANGKTESRFNNGGSTTDSTSSPQTVTSTDIQYGEDIRQNIRAGSTFTYKGKSYNIVGGFNLDFRGDNTKGPEATGEIGLVLKNVLGGALEVVILDKKSLPSNKVVINNLSAVVTFLKYSLDDKTILSVGGSLFSNNDQTNHTKSSGESAVTTLTREMVGKNLTLSVAGGATKSEQITNGNVSASALAPFLNASVHAVSTADDFAKIFGFSKDFNFVEEALKELGLKHPALLVPNDPAKVQELKDKYDATLMAYKNDFKKYKDFYAQHNIDLDLEPDNLLKQIQLFAALEVMINFNSTEKVSKSGILGAEFTDGFHLLGGAAEFNLDTNYAPFNKGSLSTASATYQRSLSSDLDLNVEGRFGARGLEGGISVRINNVLKHILPRMIKDNIAEAGLDIGTKGLGIDVDSKSQKHRTTVRFGLGGIEIISDENYGGGNRKTINIPLSPLGWPKAIISTLFGLNSHRHPGVNVDLADGTKVAYDNMGGWKVFISDTDAYISKHPETMTLLNTVSYLENQCHISLFSNRKNAEKFLNKNNKDEQDLLTLMLTHIRSNSDSLEGLRSIYMSSKTTDYIGDTLSLSTPFLQGLLEQIRKIKDQNHPNKMAEINALIQQELEKLINGHKTTRAETGEIEGPTILKKLDEAIKTASNPTLLENLKSVRNTINTALYNGFELVMTGEQLKNMLESQDASRVISLGQLIEFLNNTGATRKEIESLVIQITNTGGGIDAKDYTLKVPINSLDEITKYPHAPILSTTIPLPTKEDDSPGLEALSSLGVSLQASKDIAPDLVNHQVSLFADLYTRLSGQISKARVKSITGLSDTPVNDRIWKQLKELKYLDENNRVTDKIMDNQLPGNITFDEAPQQKLIPLMTYLQNLHQLNKHIDFTTLNDSKPLSFSYNQLLNLNELLRNLLTEEHQGFFALKQITLNSHASDKIWGERGELILRTRDLEKNAPNGKQIADAFRDLTIPPIRKIADALHNYQMVTDYLKGLIENQTEQKLYSFTLQDVKKDKYGNILIAMKGSTTREIDGETTTYAIQIKVPGLSAQNPVALSPEDIAYFKKKYPTFDLTYYANDEGLIIIDPEKITKLKEQRATIDIANELQLLDKPSIRVALRRNNQDYKAYDLADLQTSDTQLVMLALGHVIRGAQGQGKNTLSVINYPSVKSAILKSLNL